MGDLEAIIEGRAKYNHQKKLEQLWMMRLMLKYIATYLHPNIGELKDTDIFTIAGIDPEEIPSEPIDDTELKALFDLMDKSVKTEDKVSKKELESM